MGRRQDNVLKYINTDYDFTCPHLPTLSEYKTSKYYKEIFDIYKLLGGIKNEIPFCLQKQYIDFTINGKIIEIDEENHFNCYRAITFEASIYQNNKTLNKKQYLKYCTDFKDNCRTDNNFWSNSSSQKQFGISNKEGDFTGNGSSRWKQRAFYDMIKDFVPFITNGRIQVKRISIYDEVEVMGRKLTLQKILNHYNSDYKLVIRKLIDSYARH